MITTTEEKMENTFGSTSEKGFFYQIQHVKGNDIMIRDCWSCQIKSQTTNIINMV